MTWRRDVVHVRVRRLHLNVTFCEKVSALARARVCFDDGMRGCTAMLMEHIQTHTRTSWNLAASLAASEHTIFIIRWNRVLRSASARALTSLGLKVAV